MKKTIQRTGGALLVGLLLSTMFFVQVSRASDSVVAEVFVVLASEDKGEIAPALAKIKALRQPPFSSFKSMEVLQKSNVEIKKGEPVTVSLPNGRRLMLKLKQQMPDGRSKVQLSINKPNEKDYLPLLEVIAKQGEPFFVAGQKFKEKTLVIGVRIGDRVARQ